MGPTTYARRLLLTDKVTRVRDLRSESPNSLAQINDWPSCGETLNIKVEDGWVT